MSRKQKHAHREDARPEPATADPRDEVLEAHDVPTEEAPSDESTGADTGRDDGSSALRAEVDEQRDRYLRLAAEFDNYRKRTDRQRSESGVRAQVELVERLLDPLDDLQRVAGLDVDTATAASVLEGVQLVERKLLRALEGAGLEVLDAEGAPFDPEVHEALAMVPTEEESEDDQVSDVFQKGYTFKGTLVRPARVRVKRFGA
jgi:molecular chaperone GrpE